MDHHWLHKLELPEEICNIIKRYYLENIIDVTFDFDNEYITLKIFKLVIRKKINITIGKYWKIDNIEYYFDKNNKNDRKWAFTWSRWNDKEQFIEFSEYSKDKLWTDMAKWSYIRNPSKGTMQTNKVYRMFYNNWHFSPIKDIHVKVISSEYGDWDTNNYVTGYYY